MRERVRTVIGGVLGSRMSGPMGIGLASVAVTAFGGAMLLVAGGYDPLSAGGAMLRGSVGGWSAVTSFTLVRSVPLILAGLAVALAFRAGVYSSVEHKIRPSVFSASEAKTPRLR